MHAKNKIHPNNSPARILSLEDRGPKTRDWMFLSRKSSPALAKLYYLFQPSLKNFLNVYKISCKDPCGFCEGHAFPTPAGYLTI